ncbi:DMT family transporter [Paenibacillus koleovorans]|uniref:DMT family transporter n=1 Tax=Paenibacillus koleovorans TaxID=121608 RepID=UPI000FD9427A|nr:DMT family transporter [Paenibacillus koleovorans]
MIRAYAWLTFCVTIWGSNFVFGAMLVDEFPPMLLAICRLSVTITFFTCFAYFSKRFVKLNRHDWKLLLPLGFLTFINQASFYIALQDADPTTSALITSTSPIMVALLAAVFLKERFTLTMGIGSLVALAGVFSVVAAGKEIRFHAGEIGMVVSAISFSFSMIITRKWAETRDAYTISYYSTLLGTSMLIPVALSRESVFDLSTAVWAWGLLVACAILMQVVCGLVWNREMRKVGASKAAVFMNLQPFVAMVTGYWILGKPVTGVQILGSVLIVGGVLLASSQKLRGLRPAAQIAKSRAVEK